MELLHILWISLLVFGFLLLMVELFDFPGTSVAGILSVVAVVYGLIRIFSDIGTTAGWIALLSIVLVWGSLIYWFVKTKSWKKITLKDEIDAKVNVVDEQKIQIGSVGTAFSRLVPMGQGIFDGDIFEVHSKDGFLDQKTAIKVVKIEGSKIFVSAYTTE